MFAHHRGYWKTGLSVALLLTMGTTVSAQSDPQKTKVFTLEEAVEFALKNYPAVRASLERVRAAQAGVGVARTSYLPRTDLLWQSNRATDNNIAGLTIPNSVIAPITGPVPASPSNRSAWGSASGLLFSWEPLDFGYRGAKVDAARAAQNRAAAEASLTRLDVSVATVNAYLTLVAAEQTLRAAQADVERRETFAKSVHVLVDNQLRAGADASRADAERARARVNLARAEQQAAISRAQLADILGIADQGVEVRESVLVGAPSAAASAAASVALNPFAQVQHARVQEEQSLVHALDRSYYPKLYLQSVVMGRGSGVDPSGKFLGGTEGLGPDRANWAAGLSFTFPVFDIFSIESKKAVEAANERAEEARYDQTLQDLTGQLRKAQASLDGARKVAENTPLELDAARTTETQERARYQAANFQSLKLALVVLSAVPAVICGVLFMLLLTGTSLNVQSFMGAIMAIGVAVANAILLVTFAEEYRRAGNAALDAALHGAKTRMRPILMTSMAMIAGMVPMALAIGEGSQQTAPLGRAVIGGLLFATAATLLILPLVFSLVQQRAGVGSPSLDPDDPASAFARGTAVGPGETT